MMQDPQIRQTLQRLPPKHRMDVLRTQLRNAEKREEEARAEAERAKKRQEKDLMAEFLAATDAAAVDKAAAFIQDILEDLEDRKKRDDAATRRDFFKELCLHLRAGVTR